MLIVLRKIFTVAAMFVVFSPSRRLSVIIIPTSFRGGCSLALYRRSLSAQIAPQGCQEGLLLSSSAFSPLPFLKIFSLKVPK